MAEWKTVRNFPGYSISSDGEVRHDKNGRFLQPRLNQQGVAYVGLMKDDRQWSRVLARMVAIHFLSLPTEIFDTPINLDGDPFNCQVSNLMWRPRTYAVKYKRQFEDPYEYPINEPVHAIDKFEHFPDSFSAACRYGLLEREVVMSIRHRTPAWPTYQYFELVEMN